MRAYFVPKKHIEVDIHGMTLQEAKRYIELTVMVNNQDIEEIIVIHGYRNGNTLRTFVQNEFESELIERKYLWLNPGITSLILRKSS